MLFFFPLNTVQEKISQTAESGSCSGLTHMGRKEGDLAQQLEPKLSASKVGKKSFPVVWVRARTSYDKTVKYMLIKVFYNISSYIHIFT